MSKQIKIDFVSDVSCPWCVIGLLGLEQALERIEDVETELRFQPFELNPDMPPEGQRLVASLTDWSWPLLSLKKDRANSPQPSSTEKKTPRIVATTRWR